MAAVTVLDVLEIWYRKIKTAIAQAECNQSQVLLHGVAPSTSDCNANQYMKFSSGKSTYQDCIYSCETCKNAQACTTCLDPFIRDADNGQCKCPDHYYNIGNGCRECQEGCKTCTSIAGSTDLECRACIERGKMVSGACVAEEGQIWLPHKKCSKILTFREWAEENA